MSDDSAADLIQSGCTNARMLPMCTVREFDKTLSSVDANWRRPKSSPMHWSPTELKLHKRNSFTFEFSNTTHSIDVCVRVSLDVGVRCVYSWPDN